MSAVITAEAKILERLRSIEAAIHDLCPVRFEQSAGGELASDPTAFDVHRNRVAILLINLYHLKDDARGLARVKGLDKRIVEEFCNNTAAVDLCVKAGDTYKHGIGGRADNNTVIEYEVLLCRQQGAEPKPTDPVVKAVMLVVDKDGMPHQSDLRAAEALRAWAAFLEGKLGMPLPEWLKSWLSGTSAPNHSSYSLTMPLTLIEHMKNNASRRK